MGLLLIMGFFIVPIADQTSEEPIIEEASILNPSVKRICKTAKLNMTVM